MSEEYSKLVARIQHFYEVVSREVYELETLSVSAIDAEEQAACRSKIVCLHTLIDEYSKTFQEFLYKEKS